MIGIGVTIYGIVAAISFFALFALLLSDIRAGYDEGRQTYRLTGEDVVALVVAAMLWPVTLAWQALLWHSESRRGIP